MQKYDGKFPDSYDEIRKLKGIGDYTAAAIASISFGSENAVIDGNVYRVLSRIFGIDNAYRHDKGEKRVLRIWPILSWTSKIRDNLMKRSWNSEPCNVSPEILNVINAPLKTFVLP